MSANDATFYIQNDATLFNNLLYTNDSYLQDLRDYNADDWTGISLIGNALYKAPADNQMSFLVSTLVDHNSAAANLLGAARNMREDQVNALWDRFGADSFNPDDTTGSIDELASNIIDLRLQNQVAQIESDFLTQVDDPSRLNFYQSLISNDDIFKDENLKGRDGEITSFEANIMSTINHYAEHGQILQFFSQWSGTDAWVAAHADPVQKLQIIYNTDPNTLMQGIINNAPDAIDQTLASLDALTITDYANRAFDAGFTSVLSLQLSDVSDEFSLAEHHLYGSSALGIAYYDNATVWGSDFKNINNFDNPSLNYFPLNFQFPWYSQAYKDLVTANQKQPWNNWERSNNFKAKHLLGMRQYSLSDHLGNVLATILDRKTGHLPGGSATNYDYWTADIANAQYYYPFGSMMPGKIVSATNGYRFGFNGQEKDNEVKGIGNSLNFKYRMEDTRLGRFFSVDPLASKYPSLSTYQFAGNTPIWARELEGLEPWYTNEGVKQADVPKTGDGSYDMGAIEPDKYGPYSTEYANSKGYDSHPTIALPEVEVSLGKGTNSGTRASQIDQIVNSDKYYNAAYHPYIPKTPDYVGLNLGGSFLFGGGASGNVGIGWLRNEGLTVTLGTGGGVGLDMGGSTGFQWAYSQKGAAASSLKSFVGTDVSLGGQAVIGLTHARDLSYDKNGRPTLGAFWHSYQIGLGAEIQGNIQVGTTWGTSWKQLTSKPKNYNIE